MKNLLNALFSMLMITSLLNAKDIYATFTVDALHDAKLAFIASGIVKRVNVRVGSHVKKGEILAELQNSDIKAMLSISQTTLLYAGKDYKRQLKIKKLIDAAKFDAVAYKYENAKNQLAYQQALYDKTFLRAPFDGVIYEKDVEVGDAVSAMMLKTIFKLQSEKKRKIILSFDQKNRKLVKKGDIFRYTVDADNTLHKGKIVKVYPRVNTTNRKISAEVYASGFLPGLFGDGYIEVKE